MVDERVYRRGPGFSSPVQDHSDDAFFSKRLTRFFVISFYFVVPERSFVWLLFRQIHSPFIFLSFCILFPSFANGGKLFVYLLDNSPQISLNLSICVWNREELLHFCFLKTFHWQFLCRFLLLNFPILFFKSLYL